MVNGRHILASLLALGLLSTGAQVCAAESFHDVIEREVPVMKDGTRLAVRLMGESAAVSVNDAAEVDLPAMGSEGTTFSDGRLTLAIVDGRLSWGVGRAAPSACSGG